LYLNPFFAKNVDSILHESNPTQSAQVSNWRSLKQHNFMVHLA